MGAGRHNVTPTAPEQRRMLAGILGAIASTIRDRVPPVWLAPGAKRSLRPAEAGVYANAHAAHSEVVRSTEHRPLARRPPAMV
jgi:hypothetical protein